MRTHNRSGFLFSTTEHAFIENEEFQELLAKHFVETEYFYSQSEHKFIINFCPNKNELNNLKDNMMAADSPEREEYKAFWGAFTGLWINTGGTIVE